VPNAGDQILADEKFTNYQNSLGALDGPLLGENAVGLAMHEKILVFKS
jgi:hypothetical protein